MKGHEDDGMFFERIGSTMTIHDRRLSDPSLERR